MADEARAVLRRLRVSWAEEWRLEQEEQDRINPRWPNGPRCSHCANPIAGPHKMSCHGPRPSALEILAASAAWPEIGEEE
jgi:hypothetical protein